MDKKLVIFIPALDEEKTIDKVIRGLPRHMKGIGEVHVIVVDDGSRDETVRVAREAGAHVFSHSHNRGVGAAFQTGIHQALKLGADILVSIDADGQFNSEDIPAIIQPVLSGKVDFVTGNRFAHGRPKNMPRLKYWGNRRVAKLTSRIAGEKLADVACGFRAYSREAMLNLNLVGNFTYTQETILNLVYKGFRFAEVPVHVKYFEGRESRVAGSVMTYALRSMNIMLKAYRDYQPLKFFGYTGIAIFVVGLLFDIFVFIHFLRAGQFTPYKSIGVVGGLLNIIGILTFIVGFLGDMLGRIRMNQEKLLYYQKKREYDQV